MFASFNATVKKDKIDNVPEEILAVYNSKIPDDLNAKYVATHDGQCVLDIRSCDPKSAITITLPANQLLDAVPSDVKTQDDLVKYLYRTQKVLHFKPSSQGEAPYMTISNGNHPFKIYLKDLVKEPLSSTPSSEIVSWYIVPPPFPDMPPVKVIAGDIALDLKAARIPDENAAQIVLQTESNFWLQLIMHLSVNPQIKSTIKIKCDYKKCKSVDSLLEAFAVTDAFQHGNYAISYMAEHPPIKLSQCVSPSTVAFWEKVQHLQHVLGLNFDPHVPIYNRDVKVVNRLYQSFVCHKPYAVPIQAAENTGITLEDMADSFFENIGRPVALTYLEHKETPILGQTISTYAFCCLFDAIISDISEISSELCKSSDTTQRRFFAHISPVNGKTIKLVAYVSLSEDDVNDYINRFKDHNALLQHMNQIPLFDC